MNDSLPLKNEAPTSSPQSLEGINFSALSESEKLQLLHGILLTYTTEQGLSTIYDLVVKRLEDVQRVQSPISVTVKTVRKSRYLYYTGASITEQKIIHLLRLEPGESYFVATQNCHIRVLRYYTPPEFKDWRHIIDLGVEGNVYCLCDIEFRFAKDEPLYRTYRYPDVLDLFDDGNFEHCPKPDFRVIEIALKKAQAEQIISVFGSLVMLSNKCQYQVFELADVRRHGKKYLKIQGRAHLVIEAKKKLLIVEPPEEILEHINHLVEGFLDSGILHYRMTAQRVYGCISTTGDPLEKLLSIFMS